MQTDTFALAALWAQADLVIRAVALALALMSLLAWYLICVRVLRHWHGRHGVRAVEDFWTAPTLPEALRILSAQAPDSSFDRLARQGAAAVEHLRRHAGATTLGNALNADEFLLRTLRRSIAASAARLEGGLTALASIGSIAPFIGLFGTVWGIYHALASISAAGQATLDKVAGPVGEALIMTAFGLFAAIPAALAYNVITRVSRNELAELDAFAHDLHAWLSTGAKLAPAEALRPALPAIVAEAA